MSLNNTVTKKTLETIVHETFSNFGFLCSSSLLDSLKLLGFFYATNAGISINIEDLKTPDVKKRSIEQANKEIEKISYSWLDGMVSDQERFQSIIDSWNIATESLKNRIVEYYQDFDPANNLYIMAFSGARGNMSQVRQLVGMRGLMSDQEGKIIDLPIQTNFREGLSSIDYIISSYGARKGIVDTALKTADSGYLTRRLIYLAQDLIIRELDCKSKKGITIFLKKNTTLKNLIGRQLITVKKGKFPFLDISASTKDANGNENPILTSKILNDLKAKTPLLLTIRSSLTCKSNGSICQKCYGWDLAHQKLVSLGESVGIIAAQSIGEPGTQLTMRTFHTGGIFTGENLKQLKAPFSGKLTIPFSLKTIVYRTNHGLEVLKLQQEAEILLVNWKGIETTLFLEIGSYLYIRETSFVYKGQLIAEFLNQAVISSQRKLKPIYTRIGGKIFFDTMLCCYRLTMKSGKVRRITLNPGLVFIASGKIFSLPTEAEYFFSGSLKKEKAIGRLKIVAPKSGLIFITPSSLSILREDEKITINFLNFQQISTSFLTRIIPIVRNYQYVDEHHIVAFLYIFPLISSEKILSVEKTSTKLKTNFFVTTENNCWNLYSSSSYFAKNFLNDKNISIGPKNSNSLNSLKELKVKTKNDRNYSSLNSFILLNQEHFRKKKNENLESFSTPKNDFLNSQSLAYTLTPNKLKNSILSIKQSGLNLHVDRAFNLFQHLNSIFIPTSTIINYKENDLVLEKTLFATLAHYSQQTDDIVQGLPKVEELIEARKPKFEAYLSKQPGILLNIYITKDINSKLQYNEFQVDLASKKFECIHSNFSGNEKFGNTKKQKDGSRTKESEKKKQVILIGHSCLKQKNSFIYQNHIYNLSYFSNLFKYNEENFQFENEKENQLFYALGSGKDLQWQKESLNNDFLELFLEHLKKQIELKKNITNFHSKTNFSELEKETIVTYSAINDQNKKDFIVSSNQGIVYLKQLAIPLTKYILPLTSKILVKPGDFIDIGEPFSDGIIDSHELLNIFFSYHCEFDGVIEGTHKSLNKFQLVLSNSIQSIYQAQGVNISSKHLEIIVRQMTSKVIIKDPGGTPFLPGELVSTSLILEVYKAMAIDGSFKSPSFEPKLLSATTASLNKDGFLSAAGFQETRKILTKAALEGTSDWLRGLKESLMSGRIIPSGSAFLNYKNYLDNLYTFKD